MFLDSRATVVAVAEGDDPPPITGIWSDRDGQLQVLAATEPEQVGALAGVDRQPGADRFGNVVFWGTRYEGSEDEGWTVRGSLEVADRNSGVRTVLRQGDAIGPGMLSHVERVALADDGRVAAAATLLFGERTVAALPVEAMEGSGRRSAAPRERWSARGTGAASSPARMASRPVTSARRSRTRGDSSSEGRGPLRPRPRRHRHRHRWRRRRRRWPDPVHLRKRRLPHRRG